MHFFSFKDAEYIFPMEEIVERELSGSVQGDLIGDVKLVPGKRGHALYVNGVDQWVNIGNQRHNCMGDLIQCNNGFVMAMWIQMHSNNGDKYYISNGGQTYRSMGVGMMMRDKKNLVKFRTATRKWVIVYDTAVYLHTWYHVVLAWDIVSGGKIYINGILVSHDQGGSNANANTEPNAYVDFIIGTQNKGFTNPGEMTLDELRIWDALWDDQEILGLYAADAFHWNIFIDQRWQDLELCYLKRLC